MLLRDAKQISTRQGDEGFSRDLANDRISKDDLLFETMGTLDELSAVLGLCYHVGKSEFVKIVQKALLSLNSGVAWNPDSSVKKPAGWAEFGEPDVELLQTEEQRSLDQKPIEAKFTLLGSEDTLAGAHFNLARTVCRRAERRLVAYIRQTNRTDLGWALKYLNRLSDLLFIWTKNA